VAIRTSHVVALLAATLAAPARAQVYTWVDDQGTVHFEQEPPAQGARARKVELPPEQEVHAAPADAPPRPKATRPAAKEPPGRARPAPAVELYATSWCPWCKKAREFFRSRGIAFTEHDIETEAGALERKLGVDGDRHVPTAIIGGTVVKGYAPGRYQAALEAR